MHSPSGDFFVYLISQSSLYKVYVYETGIEILYYLRFKGLNRRIVANSQIKEVRYYAYTLNSPISLKVFYMDKMGKCTSFRFKVEDSQAVEFLKMYETLGIKISDRPKGSLHETDFYEPSLKQKENYR